MEAETNTNLVFVALPLPFVQGLLALTHIMDKRVTDSLRAGLEMHQRVPDPLKPETPPLTVISKRGAPVSHDTNLIAEILGQRVRGVTLPDLFARCVDLIHELDPSVIERLSGKKTHARRYVARRKEDIHFRSPHLETIETAAGWWISANVSEQQVTSAMRLLAGAANLIFGRDIIFPAKV